MEIAQDLLLLTSAPVYARNRRLERVGRVESGEDGRRGRVDPEVERGGGEPPGRGSCSPS